MTDRAPRFRVRERLSASKMNRMAKAVDSAASPFNKGPGRGPGIQPGQLLILEVSILNHTARTITCVVPGQTQPTPRLYVLSLPALFKETIRGSATYTYPTDNINARQQIAPITENQEITPNIIVGEEVYALYRGFGRNLEWFPGGRMWAAV